MILRRHFATPFSPYAAAFHAYAAMVYVVFTYHVCCLICCCLFTRYARLDAAIRMITLLLAAADADTPSLCSSMLEFAADCLLAADIASSSFSFAPIATPDDCCRFAFFAYAAACYAADCFSIRHAAQLRHADTTPFADSATPLIRCHDFDYFATLDARHVIAAACHFMLMLRRCCHYFAMLMPMSRLLLLLLSFDAFAAAAAFARRPAFASADASDMPPMMSLS